MHIFMSPCKAINGERGTVSGCISSDSPILNSYPLTFCRLTWKEANRSCEQQGSSLVTVNSYEELGMIVDIFNYEDCQSYQPELVFLGLHGPQVCISNIP